MIIAANWKMRMDYQPARDFLSQFNKLAVKEEDAENFIFFPPAGLAFLFQKERFYWGGQNVHHKAEGAFTGENSARTLKNMGASFCLLGHSERRYIFGETDIDIEKKFHTLQELALIPVLCLGESLGDRFNKEKILKIQLSWIKNYIKYEKLPFHPEKTPKAFQNTPFIAAYEPLWSIGSGDVPSLSEAEEAAGFIKEYLPFEGLKVFYGGSLDPSSAKLFSKSRFIEGLLVGGASLDPDKLYKIYQEAKS